MTADLQALIRDVPDFPKPGIVFKDITPLLANASGFGHAVDAMAEKLATHRPDVIAGIESRGFILGAPIALKMGLPLALVRKAGKLPYKTEKVSYDLEYGSDTVEVHVDAFARGQRVAVVDDLIATGGTARATAELVEKMGAELACYAFLIELSFLEGRKKLAGAPVDCLLKY